MAARNTTRNHTTATVFIGGPHTTGTDDRA